MADRRIIDAGLGYVSSAQKVLLDKEGKITPAVATYLTNILFSIVNALNGKLTLGDGAQSSKAGNIDAQWITVLTPAVADTEFAVDHGLGRLAVGAVIFTSDKAATIYVSSTGSWTSSRLYLKCNVASATLRLLVA